MTLAGHNLQKTSTIIVPLHHHRTQNDQTSEHPEKINYENEHKRHPVSLPLQNSLTYIFYKTNYQPVN
jgi:hypothetical protein